MGIIMLDIQDETGCLGAACLPCHKMHVCRRLNYSPSLEGQVIEKLRSSVFVISDFLKSPQGAA